MSPSSCGGDDRGEIGCDHRGAAGGSETRLPDPGTEGVGAAFPGPTPHGGGKAPQGASPQPPPPAAPGIHLPYLRLHQPARLCAGGRGARGAERRVHGDAVPGAVQGGEALGARGALADLHVALGRQPFGRGPGVEEPVAFAEAGVPLAHQPAFQRRAQGEEAAQRQPARGAHGGLCERGGRRGLYGRPAGSEARAGLEGKSEPGAARLGDRTAGAGLGGPGGGGGSAS